ncbi:putative phage tail protein [Psychrobacillus sp. NPDC093180]|uniref:putative phage tail protein n=1 Tax=Psychrobacillus sp. NPDC093180 TaxID=3364489 RepID=UPI0038138F5E
MNAIQESEWVQVITHKWGDLNLHKWEDFRLALMESESLVSAQGVVIKHTGSVMETIPEMQAQGVQVKYSPTIMRSVTEMIANIVVSERDYKTDMIKSLPLYERKSSVLQETLGTFDKEFRNIEQKIEVVERNIFLDTAIESLSISERDLGIQKVDSLSYNQRREQIASRNRASFDQTTEETIKSVASAYGNGEVEINTTDIAGIFEIKFVGIGIPNNLDGLKKALGIIMPAHLGIKYTFTFSPWDSVDGLTWGETTGKNWNELRIWDEVS